MGLYTTAQNAGGMAARAIFASGKAVERPSWEELRDRADAWFAQQTITLPTDDLVGRALVRRQVMLAYSVGYAYEIGLHFGAALAMSKYVEAFNQEHKVQSRKIAELEQVRRERDRIRALLHEALLLLNGCHTPVDDDDDEDDDGDDDDDDDADS